MKPLMPSTEGDLTIHLILGKSTITVPKQFAHFRSIRPIVNASLARLDTDPNNPVESVRIEFEFN